MPDHSSPSQIVIRRHMRRLAEATVLAADKDDTVRIYVEDPELSDDLDIIVPLWIPLGIVRDLKEHMPPPTPEEP